MVSKGLPLRSTPIEIVHAKTSNHLNCGFPRPKHYQHQHQYLQTIPAFQPTNSSEYSQLLCQGIALASFDMKVALSIIAVTSVSLVAGQTLNIPTRVGNVQRARASRIAANRDFGNAEFDSGILCNEGEGGDPVFILNDGVTISNLIIGPNQIDGRSPAMPSIETLH